MKMMKKIVLIMIVAAQATILNAAPRGCNNQKPPQARPAMYKPAKSKGLNRMSRACGCQRPQQPQQVPAQPIQQENPQLLEQAADIQIQAENENRLVEECCAMLMTEAQKLSNSCLAQEIAEMVQMVEMQEMQKCPCNQPKPQQQPQVQQQPQSGETQNIENADVATLEEIPSRILLAECCLALLDEAENNGDDSTIGRIEMIMDKVDMIPCMTK